MTIVIWFVVGALIGWAASVMMCTDTEQRLALNVVVGVVGAFLGGWLLSGLFSSSTVDQVDFSVTSVVVSLVGAIILVGLLRVVRRA